MKNNSNPYFSIEARLKNLSKDEKILISDLIDAIDDAIAFKNIEMERIPENDDIQLPEEKSKAIDELLSKQKDYEGI